MSNTHTQHTHTGPVTVWRTKDEDGYRKAVIQAANGFPLAVASGYRTDYEFADRIVACVNACEGMDDPERTVAAAIEEAGYLRSERNTLRAHNAALEEALRKLVEFRDGYGTDFDHDDADTYFSEARAALAGVQS